MHAYRAPLRDIRFVVHDVLDFEDHYRSYGRDDLSGELLEGVLEDFGVKGEIIHVRPGPVVTLYELEPAPGIKSSRVIGLADDIARSMSAIACRVAVVPGRNAIGIELPNPKRETVYLREMLASQDFETTKSKLALALGKTINGEAVVVDIAKMPHVLVAGEGDVGPVVPGEAVANLGVEVTRVAVGGLEDDRVTVVEVIRGREPGDSRAEHCKAH